MKTFIIDNVNVNRNIKEVFDIMYNCDNNIIKSGVSDMIDYQMDDWHLKKKILQKREYITIKIDDIPDLYAKNLDNDLKHIKILKINKLMFQDDKKYTVHMKYRITNLVPVVQTILNALNLVKCKCKVNLVKVDEHNTNVSIKSKTSVFLPYASEIEEYIHQFSNLFFGNIMQVLQRHPTVA